MVPHLSRPVRAREQSRRRRGSLRWIWPVLLLGVGGLVAAALVLSRDAGTVAPTSLDVERYDSAIRAPVQHWGKIAALGMRPALADLVSGQGVPPSLIAGEARAWQDGLNQVQQQMHAVPVPASLRSAADGFDQALQAYLHAAQLFEQAAAGGSDAQGLMHVGADALTRADCVYDDAAVAVQAALRAAGLAADPGLPATPCASGGS
ncbi:MAG TPA: hypothetical protein VFC09_00980 [Candidatus Dormibacteraeota bacterium]|nr:hypothetical protein [Candidatus Dormibacteraeota bacterium]